jgi:hypothetical protein
VEEGKKLAKARGTSEWKQIVTGDLKQQPGPLSAEVREAAEALYSDFQKIVVDGTPSTRFTDALKKLKK